MTTAQWPPVADEATAWQEFLPRESREAVRARQVPLWGQRVWVAEFGDGWQVWCPCCRQFLSLEVLGKPYNGHAVGIRTPEGTIVAAEPGDDGPPPARSGFIDLMRVPW